MIELELPYPPSLNRLYRSGLKNACARCRKTAIPISYPSDEYENYQEIARGRLATKSFKCILKPAQVSVTATFYRPQRSGDLDNFFKALLDMLSGHVFEDDSQIAELHAYRCEDKIRPRVELAVVELPSAQGVLL